jgi:hypothetical protein
LNYFPNEFEVTQIRERASQRSSAATAYNLYMRNRVSSLINLVRHGDAQARAELSQLITSDPRVKILFSRLKRYIPSKERYARAGIITGQRSVPGGAPGLGKRA